MRNWKTTVCFLLAGLCEAASQQFPEVSDLLRAGAGLATALGGLFAKDS